MEQGLMLEDFEGLDLQHIGAIRTALTNDRSRYENMRLNGKPLTSEARAHSDMCLETLDKLENFEERSAVRVGIPRYVLVAVDKTTYRRLNSAKGSTKV
jgi:hypothetical protein